MPEGRRLLERLPHTRDVAEGETATRDAQVRQDQREGAKVRAAEAVVRKLQGRQGRRDRRPGIRPVRDPEHAVGRLRCAGIRDAPRDPERNVSVRSRV